MRFLVRFMGFLFAAGTVVFLVGVAATAGLIWHYSRDLPDYSQLQDYEPPVMTRVHASDGALLGEYSKERRLYLPIQAVPKMVINAFLAAEDKNFYERRGIAGLFRQIGQRTYHRGSGLPGGLAESAGGAASGAQSRPRDRATQLRRRSSCGKWLDQAGRRRQGPQGSIDGDQQEQCRAYLCWRIFCRGSAARRVRALRRKETL